MAYKFKLQSVLNYRQILEDQAQQQLSSSLQQRLELRQQMTRVAERLMQTDRELKLKQQKGMDIADLTLFEDQISHCQRQLDLLRKQQLRLERTIDEQRQELLQASMERQVMEKLRDKQKDEYLREEGRKERELLDEISLRGKGDSQ